MIFGRGLGLQRLAREDRLCRVHDDGGPELRVARRKSRHVRDVCLWCGLFELGMAVNAQGLSLDHQTMDAPMLDVTLGAAHSLQLRSGRSQVGGRLDMIAHIAMATEACGVRDAR